ATRSAGIRLGDVSIRPASLPEGPLGQSLLLRADPAVRAAPAVRANPGVREGPAAGGPRRPPAPPAWSADLGARGHQVLAGPDHARGHARLAGPAPGAGVVLLLVADLAVDLQHAVVIAEHVVRDRPGERVLGVGIHVHLDHAIRDGLADLFQRGA